MSPYAKLIADQTGAAPDAVALIEDLMRTDRTGLDHLTRAEFAAAVIEAVRDAAELEAAGMLAFYCNAVGIPVPAAAA